MTLTASITFLWIYTILVPAPQCDVDYEANASKLNLRNKKNWSCIWICMKLYSLIYISHLSPPIRFPQEAKPEGQGTQVGKTNKTLCKSQTGSMQIGHLVLKKKIMVGIKFPTTTHCSYQNVGQTKGPDTESKVKWGKQNACLTGQKKHIKCTQLRSLRCGLPGDAQPSEHRNCIPIM